MTSACTAYRRNGATHRGFSLVELMIAMLLGLLLVQGILLLFSATNRVHATQSALSRLQESGRVALSRIAEDLDLAGYLPCGSRIRPQIFADALSSHIDGSPAIAGAPAGAALGTPYALDRGIFIGGNTCSGKVCKPELAQGLPRSGLAIGDKVPGTDVLTVRYLQGDGWKARASGAQPACAAHEAISTIAISGADGGPAFDGFKANHLALWASCSAGEVFQVSLRDDAVRPLAGRFGLPGCLQSDAHARLYDLDTQLLTAVYYLQLVEDRAHPGRVVAALMRRSNGVARELARGIERLDFRYSITDGKGAAHWLTADELERGVSGDGESLDCGGVDDSVNRRCAWSDVNAVEVSMLVNTVDELPADPERDAGEYRYSIDDNGAHTPGVTMPVTGLPAGHMLRREFRSVVALRNLAS